MNPQNPIPPEEPYKPFEQDVIIPAKGSQPPLSEKDFFHEPSKPPPWPLWLWLFLGTAIIAIIWGSMGWFEEILKKEKTSEPFLDVTNRDFSLFLWQFPSYLRANVTQKTGYLPGFEANKPQFNPEYGSQIVAAPPELLFLYHTWNRLLSKEDVLSPIPGDAFAEFLQQVPEWQPANWPEAPALYGHFIAAKEYQNSKDLRALPQAVLPLPVRQAFQGWHNFFKDGEAINHFKITVGQVQNFLDKHPNYKRNLWRNIDTVLGQPVAGKSYLLVLLGLPSSAAEVPQDQLSTFLRTALYNMEHSWNRPSTQTNSTSPPQTEKSPS